MTSIVNKVFSALVRNSFILKSQPRFNARATQFHSGRVLLGFEEFIEPKKANETMSAGRSWTVPDLRRKSFEDLHGLWFILYKERNLLLSEKSKRQRLGRPPSPSEELRYACVKRSMGGIKHVLDERRKIYRKINAENKSLETETETHSDEESTK